MNSKLSPQAVAVLHNLHAATNSITDDIQKEIDNYLDANYEIATSLKGIHYINYLKNLMLKTTTPILDLHK